MSYLLKRYTHGVKRYKVWFLLVFLMPGLYLLSAFYTPDRYTVWQDVWIPPGTRLASATLPSELNSIDEVVTHQALFFHHNFTVHRYFNLAMENVQLLDKEYYQRVKAAIRENLSLSCADDIARITYRGKDPELGRDLVGYYAGQLVQRAREGMGQSGLPDTQAPQPKQTGYLETSATRALWLPERLGPLLTLFMVSLLAVLMLIAALEWNDAALKSERQIARYVNLPVLGSLPDLNRITRIIGEPPPGYDTDASR